MSDPVGARIELTACSIPGADCFYCEIRALYTIHDARGCVPVCGWCTRWRAAQSVMPGHMDGCTGVVEVEEEKLSRRRRPLKEGIR